MHNSKLISCILFTLLTNSANAGTMGRVTSDSLWPSVMTLSIGSSWAALGETQTFFLQSDIEKTYAANKQSNALVNGEFFVGWSRVVSPSFEGQFGLAAAIASSARGKGDIWEDADPAYNNFFYNYSVNHAHLAVKGKLIANTSKIRPYVQGSLGVGLNRSHDFSMTPKIFEAVPAPAFTNHTTTAFAYTVGLGLQKAFNDHLQGGLGYEFADWGKSQLAPAFGQTTNSALQSCHLYTNQLQLSISYNV